MAKKRRRARASSRQRIATGVATLAVALVVASLEMQFPPWPWTVGSLLIIAFLMWVEYPVAQIGRDAYGDVRKRAWSWPIAAGAAALAVAGVLVLRSVLPDDPVAGLVVVIGAALVGLGLRALVVRVRRRVRSRRSARGARP